MSLPIDRTALTAAQTNQVPSQIIQSAKNIAAIQTPYDGVDELYNYVLGLIAGGVLQPYPAFQSRQGAINENFDVWQRGTTFTNTNSYTADRWALYHDHTSASVSRQETFLPDGSRYVARLTNTTRGAGTSIQLFQTIETMNCLAFINKVVTVTVKVRKNSVLAAGNLVVGVNYTTIVDDSSLSVVNGTSAGSITTPASNLTTSFQTITFNATIPSNARTIGISINLKNSPTDGGYIEVTQVQICAGSVSLPFQPRSALEELQLCQRYYEKTYSQGVNPATNTQVGTQGGIAVLTGYIFGSFKFQVTKRVNPTVTLYSATGTTNKVTNTAGTDVGVSVTVNNVSTSGFPFVVDSGSGFTVGNGYYFHFAADSEL